MEEIDELLSKMMNVSRSGIAPLRCKASASRELDVVRASEEFDKTVLVRHHIQSYRIFEENERIITSSGNSFGKQSFVSIRQSPPSQRSTPSVPLKGLKEIQLPDLRIEKIHRGRVLYGTLCVDASKLADIFTVMEDESGRAIRVQINNVASSTSTFDEVQRLYPKGTKLAVKEPYMKRGAVDGCLMLRVDNPASIEFISPPLPGGSTSARDFSLEELRKCGNQSFAEGDWTRAIDIYSRCIEKGTSSLDQPAISSKTVMQSGNQDTLLSYANRAEAWLKLGNFEKALSDCGNALDIDSRHLKSLYRKGRALHGLQQYEEAIASFQSALQHSPGNTETLSCLEKSLKFDSQSRTGNYDISKYLLSGRKKGAPEVSDYVGDVVIQTTADGRGRGLFATRDVKAGDLLLVSNTLAVAYDSAKDLNMRLYVGERFMSAGDHDLIVKLVELGGTSRKALLQMYCLTHSSGQEINLEVPPMDLFKPNKSYSYCTGRDIVAEKIQLDVERITNIVRLNSFGRRMSLTPSLTPAAMNPREGNGLRGLWILPSFINHSCVPNASKLFVGEAMFVHATRNISQGREITLDYINPLKPFTERSEMFIKWEFVCNCDRCNLERSLQTAMDQITAKYLGIVKSIEERGAGRRAGRDLKHHSPGFGSSEAKEFKDLIIELEKTINSSKHSLKLEEKHWIRASFTDAYLQVFSDPSIRGSLHDVFPTEEDLAESLKVTAPGHLALLLLTSKIAREACSVKALQIAMEACVAFIGNQEQKVLQHFLLDPLTSALSLSW